MHYNLVAGRDIGRLSALMDGIFAFAMTLLVIDIRIPDPASIHNESALLAGLWQLRSHFVVVAMTFLTLGIFWVGQQTQLAQFKEIDRNITWLYIAFMFAVVMMPFSTALLAAYIAFLSALLVYWFNILVLGVIIFAVYRYGYARKMMREDAFPLATLERRVVIAQSLYAVGAALCVIDPRLSIAEIFLVQLNYAVAPRIGWLYRL